MHPSIIIIFVASYLLLAGGIRGGSRLLKRGGTTRPVIIDDVGLVRYVHSQCVKHTWHAKHASTRGSEGMPPENFEKLHLLRLNLRAFLVIYQPLMFL